MGQYKQWQHYRETDQQLRSQLTQLKADLLHLKSQVQTQAELLEQSSSLSTNPLIRSLLTQTHPPIPIHEQPATPDPIEPPISPLPTPPTDTTPEPTSTPEIPIISPEIPVTSPETPLAASSTTTAQEEISLSSTDAELSPDLQEQTAPLRAIPWWFRNTPVHPSSEGPFIDQQSARTNQSVERWLERWGNHDTTPTQEEEQR